MDYVDFTIRAWLTDEEYVQVLVHNSPVGDMSQPVKTLFRKDLMAQVTVALVPGPEGYRVTRQGRLAAARALSYVLLPSKVYSLLASSLDRLLPGQGLRIRLCLDAALADFPWEYLWRPDVPCACPSSQIARFEHSELAGFLILDSRISLVRGAPLSSFVRETPRRREKILCAGTLQMDGLDYLESKNEYERISQSLRGIRDLVDLTFITAAGDNIETTLLMDTVSIFHYIGHTDVDQQKEVGFLLKEWDSRVQYRLSPRLRLSSQSLGDLLRRAQTRLALFSACNSGRYAFVTPLLQCGIPAVIGVQGLVRYATAITFCQKLYAGLAIGLSLDEAVSSARLHLVNAEWQENIWDWGGFLVHLSTVDPILFPKPDEPDIHALQLAAREERQRTIIHVTQFIGVVYGGQVSGVAYNSENTVVQDRYSLSTIEAEHVRTETSNPYAERNYTMADPITLTVVGSIALTEGVKFLYGQAGELLKRWRERKDKLADAATEEEQEATEPADVTLPSTAFEGQITRACSQIGFVFW